MIMDNTLAYRDLIGFQMEEELASRTDEIGESCNGDYERYVVRRILKLHITLTEDGPMHRYEVWKHTSCRVPWLIGQYQTLTSAVDSFNNC
jgi:hypothetical protein